MPVIRKKRSEPVIERQHSLNPSPLPEMALHIGIDLPAAVCIRPEIHADFGNAAAAFHVEIVQPVCLNRNSILLKSI